MNWIKKFEEFKKINKSKLFILTVNIIILFLFVIWFLFEKTFEPFIGILGAILALFSFFIGNENSFATLNIEFRYEDLFKIYKNKSAETNNSADTKLDSIMNTITELKENKLIYKDRLLRELEESNYSKENRKKKIYLVLRINYHIISVNRLNSIVEIYKQKNWEFFEFQNVILTDDIDKIPAYEVELYFRQKIKYPVPYLIFTKEALIENEQQFTYENISV